MLTKEKATLKVASIRNAEYYNMTEKFDNLYSKSQNKENFYKLTELIEDEQNIKLAYRNIKRNKGSMTSGVDGNTIKDIEKLSQKEFINQFRNRIKNYQPKSVRRVEIPKPNGKTRPLGIPCIWDRIIQQAILQILDPICEARFNDKSYGFRPNRSTEHAVALAMRYMNIQKLHYVVDIDIKGFFDNVNHTKLKKQLWSLGIRDKKLIAIINQMLKADIELPNKQRIKSTKGTPQGGVLSPLLSNVVLNELDWWLTSQWEDIPTRHDYAGFKHKNGSYGRGHKFAALRSNSKLKEIFHVRYADDFQIYCKSYKDAVNIKYATKKWLMERLGLEINEDKSKIINLKERKSQFLGIEFKLVKKGNKYVTSSTINKNSKLKARAELKEIIKGLRQSGSTKETAKLISRYNAKVIGFHQYYQMATDVTDQCGEIQRIIENIFINRLGKRYKKKGPPITNKYIDKNYGKSKQMRYVGDRPIIPIGYIKTKNARNKLRNINKYTPKGRELIHKSLGVSLTILREMMSQEIGNRNIEFVDNRIALYVAQKGKCSITGKVLERDDIDCHHKIPEQYGGTDEYKNLVIIKRDIHKLIHSTRKETIEKYLKIIELSKTEIGKVNKLRKTAKLEAIKLMY